MNVLSRRRRFSIFQRLLSQLLFVSGSLLSVAVGTAAEKGERPNVLLICIDDLRPELGCYGVDYIHSPNIDRLAAEGRRFSHHYVQAPTCGASRFALLTGCYGSSGNGALFARSKRDASADRMDLTPSMPHWFRKHGYTTVSVGKVSHHPGGRGGKDWDDDAQPEMPLSWTEHLCPTGDWQHPRGIMHGLANGEIRKKAEEMDVFQSAEGSDTIYPDGIIVDEALRQLTTLSQAEKPFFLAVGIIRPHLPFGAPAKYMEHYRDAELPPIPHPAKPDPAAGKTTWHKSGEFMKYNRWQRNPNTDAEFATQVRKHYAACVTFADAQVGKLLDSLESLGMSNNTVVVVWGDHGWHLGEHAVWGKHTLFEESLHSPLIIRAPHVQQPGVAADGIVETIDLMPTLAELAKLPAPEFVDGVSLVPMLADPAKSGHSAVSYANAKTIRTERHRLILHKDGHTELYDHQSDNGETKNLAEEQQKLAADLTKQLLSRKPN